MNTYLQVSVFPLRTLSMVAEVVLKQYETQQYKYLYMNGVVIICIFYSDLPDETTQTVSETFTNSLPIGSVITLLLKFLQNKHNIVCI